MMQPQSPSTLADREKRKKALRKLSRYSTTDLDHSQMSYLLSSGTELRARLSAHAVLEEQIKTLSLHSHEGDLARHLGANKWQNFFFKLEPAQLLYFEKSDSEAPLGSFNLEEVLSVHSKEKKLEIEIQNNDYTSHILRAKSKEELKSWLFAIAKALACIVCQKKLSQMTTSEHHLKIPSPIQTNRTPPQKTTVAVFATQGRRGNMEDEYYISETTTTHSILAAIFDGHSGVRAAQYARDKLPEFIARRVEGSADLPQAMKEAFLECERTFLDTALENGDKSGTTALVVMVSPTEIMVSNCGDSRAVMCRGKSAFPLSQDHKPFHPEERARIEGCGGWVEEVEVLNIPKLYRMGLDLDTLNEDDEASVGWVTVYRVNGVLAMSRSIGDMLIKDLKNSTFDMTFSGELVLAEPEVLTTKLEKDVDRFVVVATDGLWDVMTNQEVVDYIISALDSGRNLQWICAKLSAEAVERGSLDNICVILIDLTAIAEKDELRLSETVSFTRYRSNSAPKTAQAQSPKPPPRDRADSSPTGNFQPSNTDFIKDMLAQSHNNKDNGTHTNSTNNNNHTTENGTIENGVGKTNTETDGSSVGGS